MSTNDPYANTPETPQQGSEGQWQPAPGAQPEYQVNSYGNGEAPGYASPPPPPPGFATGDYSAAPAPAYGAPAPGSTSTDGVSIAALIVGLLGGSVIAIILGAIGLKRTAGGIRSGRGMAWAGLILGILGTLVWAALVIFFVALVQNDDFQQSFESELEQSGTGTMFSDADTYGDDPNLDALWDACAAGDGAACDNLYSQSPLGSEYEEFGDTCGGRGLPAGAIWCEE